MSEQKTPMHTYKTQYTIANKPLTQDELQEGQGACDDIIIHSIILPPDGSYSHYLVSQKGESGKELDGNELFKAWLMMCRTLTDNESVPSAKRQLCQMVWDTFWEAQQESTEKSN